jgi:hypothetical protein
MPLTHSDRITGLQKLTITRLRKLVSTWKREHTIKGAYKMKKDELITKMITKIRTLPVASERKELEKLVDSAIMPAALPKHEPIIKPGKRESILDKKIVKHRTTKAVQMEKAAAKTAGKKAPPKEDTIGRFKFKPGMSPADRKKARSSNA